MAAGAKEQARRLITEMVATPSLMLGWNGVDADGRHGEARMERYVVRELQRLGLQSELQEVEPNRNNVLARVKGGRPGPTLLITSHVDTVEPVDWAQDPFTVREEGDVLYGLGTCDDKGSLAAMLLTLEAIIPERESLAGELAFAACIGEETFGIGSLHLVESGLRADGAIVGEPTRLGLVAVECGNVRWRLRVRGKAAHGSTPWLGESAIYRAGRVIRALEEEVAPAALENTHPLIGRAAFNVGMIEGGAAINIVPDQCALWVERRVLPGEDPMEEYHRINAQITAAVGDEWIEFEEPIAYNHPFDTPEDSGIVRAMRAALEPRGLPTERRGVTFGSDGNRLAAGDIPCVVFGPGDIAHAHTNQEHIDLNEVVQAAEIMADAAREFLSG